MNRYWFVNERYVRRDLVEMAWAAGSGSSWNVHIRTVSGQQLLVGNFFTQSDAEIELNRVLTEEI